jgi:uncharacterized protein (DUF2267 family)
MSGWNHPEEFDVDEQEFFRSVAASTGLGREEAADLTRATLQTLAQRLSEGTVRDLAVRLPDGLDEVVRGVKGRPSKQVGLEDAEEKVRERTGLRLDEVHAGFAAVLATLREAVPEATYAKVVGQLPHQFRDLVDEPT